MVEFISAKEAAEMLGIKPSRVRQLLNDKVLKGVKTPTTSPYRGEWKIDKNSVINYLSDRRKAGRPKKLQGGK